MCVRASAKHLTRPEGLYQRGYVASGLGAWTRGKQSEMPLKRDSCNCYSTLSMKTLVSTSQIDHNMKGRVYNTSRASELRNWYDA